MTSFFRKTTLGLCAAAALAASSFATAKESYQIAWTIYAGSMPLAYAQDTGILKKWGDKYGFDLEAVQLNDYMEAQTQFTSGQFAAVVGMTLDALTIPAASGVDTSVIMPMSSSLGSDGIVLRGKDKTLADIKGLPVNLVELSGSHYLLARALHSIGLSEKDITIVNTSDSDIAAIFTNDSVKAVATWKPQLSEILSQFPDSSLVFDSSKTPDELVDGMLVKTELLNKEPDLAPAIIGAWYETLSRFAPTHPEHTSFMAYMADALSTTPEQLISQFSTIHFYDAASAKTYVTSDAFKATMTHMAQFAFEHGLLGDNAASADIVGIEAGDGTVIGDKARVTLRFPTSYLGD